MVEDSSSSELDNSVSYRYYSPEFNTLFIEGMSRLKRIALSICRDPFVADDLVSTFYSIESERLIDPNRFFSWAWVCMKRRYLNLLEKARNEEVSSHRSSETYSGRTVNPVRTIAESIDIERAINELDKEEAEIVNLKYGTDMTFREIADILDCKETIVRLRWLRAQRKMRWSLRTYWSQL